MASSPRHLRVFLASPGDVVDEREIALAVLDDLPYDPFLRGKVTIEGVAWDKRGAGAPILAGLTPQDSIAIGLPRPGECDIVVVIFWSRMGTPLPDSYRKDDGGRYESGTEWEYEDGVTGFRKNESPYVLLYRRKQPVLLDPDEPEFQSKHEQYEKVRRFFARLRSPDGSAISGYTEYGAPGDFRERLEHDLRSLISRILQKPAAEPSAVAMPKPWPGSPFPGLRAFTASDAPIFFGREREIDALLDRMASHRFVAVVGASGSGKSSLVAAGAIPRLQLAAGSTGAPERVILQFTPDRLGNGDPFASLAAAILTAMPQTRQQGLALKLHEDPDLVGRLLGHPVLLFIDQFEELFTTVQESLRVPFVDLLERMIAAGDLRIVITVRGDFYGRCIEMQRLARLVEHSTVPLSAPGAVALSDMITRPAARAALTFESGLPDRILEDTGHQPGALALMAYMLDEIYRHRLGLTHAAYEELGGVQGVIGRRSERLFSSLGDDERAALPRVFRELVEVDDRGSATRLRAPLSKVAATPSARALTEALTEARLLVQSRGENHESVVEVAHEALFRSWSRLAEWIADAADDLRLLHQVRRAAADWDRSGRRDDFLWSHERLAPVYSLRERLGEELDQTLTAFIRPESERLAERIRTDTRDFRQRTDVERLIEIGAPAARVLVQSLQYVTTEATRKTIADALVALGDAAVPPLLEAASADSFANRQFVLDSLVTLEALPDKEVVRRLMDDQTAAVRATAIHLAAVTADVAAVPTIVRRFDDPDEEVSTLAVLAVSTFDDDQAFEALAVALGHARVGLLALRVVEYLLLGTKLVPRELRLVDVRKIMALVEKNRAMLSPRRIEVVASVLASPASTRTTSALRVLVRIGNMTALRAALEALSSNTKDVLSLISAEAGPEFISVLIESLDAPESYLRQDAARVVRHVFLFSDRLRAIIEARSRDDLTKRLLRLARDEDRAVSKAALSALSAMRAVPAAPFFREHMADESLRLVSIEGLGRTGNSSDVPALIAALRDPRRRVQMTAVSALQELGGEKAAAAEALSLLERIADSPGEGSFQATLIRIVMAAPPLRAAGVLKRIANSKGASHVAAAALAKLLGSAR